jgi:ATP-dependent Lon protease
MPDIPDEVKASLTFHFVKDIDQVMEIALEAKPVRRNNKPAPAK